MNKSKNSDHPAIAFSMDVLITFTLFYNFSQWSSYETIFAKIIGIFTILVVLNSWLTIRSGYNFYSLRLFIPDIIEIFIFANIPTLLKLETEWGYSPYFWLAIGVIEFFNALWDISIKNEAPATNVQKSFTKWFWLSLGASFLCFVTFIYQILSVFISKIWDEYILIGHIISAIPLIYILIMTIIWNNKRYNLSKETDSNFFNI
jgi:hypothetical protein